MRVVLCNLMVAVIIVPAMLGWCCHPSCMGAVSADDSSASESAPAPHESRCCHHSSHDDTDQSTPHKSRTDCKGICAYVLTSKLKIDRPGNAVVLYVLPIDSQQLLGHCLAANHVAQRFEPVPLTAPSLRVHAVNQIWLI
jgi:hypothetical protein